ncbi:MAG: S8 family serine peptidase, partial [Candidatus Eisenbacteria bacterium]|nr:S8 family serine peptidase [Candidatus Eisenbacteria bacterium]
AELEAGRRRGAIEGFTPYWIANLVVVRAERRALEALANRADVELIEQNFRPTLIEPVGPATPPGGGDPTAAIGITPGVKALNANQVWYDLNIRGEGAIVACLDTGVDGNHLAMRTRWRGFGGAHPAAECWHDVLGGSPTFPTDTHGHGTHVMGTITGLAPNDTIGVAPGAQWIAANAINQGVGAGFDNDVIDCYQWMADPDGNLATVDDVPDVCQNSWGISEAFGGNYVDCDTRWWAALDGLEAAGCVVTFSAGNEGPGATSLRSPADRASTLYNVFSVGAVDCTNDITFPYNIAGFSSRGPTGCNVVAELRIKPEVVAPGVDVYSSLPGGSYGYLSGTSMAGPHVAGVVGLMRSANPDLPVDDVKRILMETARDQGTAGEDNTHGWGFIDAMAAVLQSAADYGSVSGTVRNGSNGGTPIVGAVVRVVELDRSVVSNALGAYSASMPVGIYTLEALHPSFATQSIANVNVSDGTVTPLDFSLLDIAAPSISNLRYTARVLDESDPIPVTAAIVDLSQLATAELVYRVNGGSFLSVPMAPVGGGDYTAEIPPQQFGDHIEFYLRAEDVAGNAALDPPTAPSGLYDILLSQTFFTDDAESDEGWTLLAAGDTPVGTWERNSPRGTVSGGQQCEPATDHSPDPGVRCFFTLRGGGGGSRPPDESDVDGGCVTLTSPVIDLSSAGTVLLTYWRWWARLGASQTGDFEASVSSDAGATWQVLEILGPSQNVWTEKVWDLGDFIDLTSEVQVRFIACDSGAEDLVEAAIDDISFDGVTAPPAAIEDAPSSGTWLHASQPNPVRHRATLRYRLAVAGTIDLTVFDAGGRRVRGLFAGPSGPGEHQAVWDGRDDGRSAVASGVYFYRLTSGEGSWERKLLLMR